MQSNTLKFRFGWELEDPACVTASKVGGGGGE